MRLNYLLICSKYNRHWAHPAYGPNRFSNCFWILLYPLIPLGTYLLETLSMCTSKGTQLMNPREYKQIQSAILGPTPLIQWFNYLNWISSFLQSSRGNFFSWWSHSTPPRSSICLAACGILDALNPNPNFLRVSVFKFANLYSSGNWYQPLPSN